MPQRKSENKDLYIAMTVLIVFIAIMYSNTIEKFVSANSGLLSFIAFIGIFVSFLIIVLPKLSSENNKSTSNLTLVPLKKSKKPNVPDFDFLDEIEIEEPLPEIKPTEWSMELIKSLEWKSFEQLCSEYLTIRGFQSELTRCGADGGVDVRIFKDNNLYAVVQCKAYKSYKVGVKPVRELYGVMAAEYAAQGFFITSSSFTKEAEQFSKENTNLKLVSGDLLLQRIQELSKPDQQKLLDSITDGDYLTPTCPSCGVKMTLRTAKKGKNIGDEFWGCVSYPKCNQTFKSS